ncbi:hypothetical protein CRI93_02965 [Longimonas halophila]|uniref:Uncharacterized protein n=1 Tax=Longimonas halophila TaxID=1469170 RepID=A0A2H3NNW9_9BACT|nr:hypothetical protein CRI93_02965 [Longimonas halophila]
MAVSFGTLFFQFFYWGYLKLAEVNSFGMWIKYSGSIPRQPTRSEMRLLIQQDTPTGEPNRVLFVLPLLFWNTGNRNKEILNMRLKVNFGDGEQIFKPNRFVENMGMGEDGSHEHPTPVNWIHQIVLREKESELRFVEFFGEVNPDLMIFDRGTTISFNLEVKTARSGSFQSYGRFTASMNDIIDNSGGSEYTVYYTEKGAPEKATQSSA